LARNVVSTSQPLAAQAGLAAMARGGNAIDAALAAAITLTVVEPTMNGIGGDAFALVWDGSQLHGLNACGARPGLVAERFAGMEHMPKVGWDSVTTRAVAAWKALSERFGALPFEDLFTDAIRHARDGFPVSPVIARQWAQAAIDLGAQPGFTEFLKPDGSARRPARSGASRHRPTRCRRLPAPGPNPSTAARWRSAWPRFPRPAVRR
jgi:gamma-glutamyltranspeptidase/glutathione hydrolase